MSNKGLAAKLIFSVLTCSTLLLGILLGYNYLVSRQMILKNIETNAGSLARETAQRIETVLCSIKEVPETLAETLEEVPCDEGMLKNLLRSAVANNDGIYGSVIAFEPNAFDGTSRYYCPYVYKSGNKIKFAWLGSGDYQYFQFDWYQIPKELQRLAWTEPYHDEGGGNVVMSTCSVPFYKKIGNGRQFMGVVTADVSLSWLQEMVSGIKIAKTGYAFLVSKNGTFVTHPRKDLIMNETMFGLAEARKDESVRKIGRDMIRGRSGFAPFISAVDEQKCWVAYAPVASAGWSVAVVFPQDELMADVVRLSQTNILLALSGFMVLLIVIVIISRSITKPLSRLACATEEIAKGNWDAELPKLKSQDEVGALTASFASMKEALKKYVSELTATTAAKERMEGELKIAHDIQMNFVPKIFPPFPNRKQFDLFAVLEPAREVGGDLYDFFLIDEEHLCFVIGDVSGKGVPAALFMAVTKMLFKASAQGATGPDAILTKVNQELARDNASCIFVTVFCGIFDIKTGVITYANGGHNPPLILRKGKGVQYLTGPHGPPVGVVEDADFPKASLKLGVGDTLFLYTDGVTEARNKDANFFSEERLEEFLSSPFEGSLKTLIGMTQQQVKAFAGKMPQSDDITLFALKYCGESQGVNNEDVSTLTLENHPASVAKLRTFFKELADKYTLEERSFHGICSLLEEIVANIICYAYAAAGNHKIVIDAKKRDGELVIQVWDDGNPFNPLKLPKTDPEAPFGQKPAGGPGIQRVHSLAKSAEYQRRNEWNILVLKITV